MRYVLIRDDAPIEDIDEALAVLRTKQRLTHLEATQRWISEDMDELLEMRLRRSGEEVLDGRRA